MLKALVPYKDPAGIFPEQATKHRSELRQRAEWARSDTQPLQEWEMHDGDHADLRPGLPRDGGHPTQQALLPGPGKVSSADLSTPLGAGSFLLQMEGGVLVGNNRKVPRVEEERSK